MYSPFCFNQLIEHKNGRNSIVTSKTKRQKILRIIMNRYVKLYKETRADKIHWYFIANNRMNMYTYVLMTTDSLGILTYYGIYFVQQDEVDHIVRSHVQMDIESLRCGLMFVE